MQKRVRIKDISILSGVSPGTVDRIIHNRGNVSLKSREAVEKVLKEVGYRPNLHLSSISLKRKYVITIITPQIAIGEYWESIHKGIQRALNEYENIDIVCNTLTYNQYDVYSCNNTFEEAAKHQPDAYIIGPTFKKSTQHLTYELDKKNIPYIFVDNIVDETYPLARFSANQYICGYLMCKLIHAIIPEDKAIGILQAVRIGDESANTTILRKKGFDDFYNEKKLKHNIYKIPFSVTNPTENENLLSYFFEENHDIGGIVVLNSRGNIVANYLAKRNMNTVKLVCIDVTDENICALKNGYIDFLICQKPEYQGYLAMKTMIGHLIFQQPINVEHFLPLDIITKETVDLYKEFNDVT